MKMAAKSPPFALHSSRATSRSGRSSVRTSWYSLFGVSRCRRLTGPARVHPVVAGDDGGRHRQRAQFGRTQPDHRMLRPLVEGAPPLFHDADEALRVERRQTRAVGWVARDYLGEVLGAAHCFHAALLGRIDEIRVVILN